MYCILIEKSKSKRRGVDLETAMFAGGYHTVNALKSPASVKTFPDFETAQPEVKRLRGLLPNCFIYAIEKFF